MLGFPRVFSFVFVGLNTTTMTQYQSHRVRVPTLNFFMLHCSNPYFDCQEKKLARKKIANLVNDICIWTSIPNMTACSLRVIPMITTRRMISQHLCAIGCGITDAQMVRIQFLPIRPIVTRMAIGSLTKGPGSCYVSVVTTHFESLLSCFVQRVSIIAKQNIKIKEKMNYSINSII